MKKKKCIILLPTTYNDGVKVPAKVLNNILKSIEQKFDGYSNGGLVKGAYKMDDGSIAHDKSLMVWVAIDPNKVDELKRFAGKVAAILKQESIYFEITQAEVEFIRPLFETGDEL